MSLSLVNSLTNVVRNVGGVPLLKLQKISPKIAVVAGCVGIVGTVVLACRATLKATPVVADIKESVSDIKECMTEETMHEDRKEIAKVYIDGAAEIARLYAVPALLCVASIGSIVWSHNVMWRRNLEVTGLATSLMKSYQDYRTRVRNEYGEDVDRMFASGYSPKQIENFDPENNKMSVRKEFVRDEFTPSPYARVFCEGNPKWTMSPDFNLEFLRTRQAMFNNRLKARGYVFLNEVLEELGFPYDPKGQFVGWIWNPGDGAFGDGDGVIDFGLYDLNNPSVRAFLNGEINAILLDFNVDGVIYDLL